MPDESRREIRHPATEVLHQSDVSARITSAEHREGAAGEAH